MSLTCRKTLIEPVSADQVKSQLRWLKMQHCMPFFLVLSRSCRVWESGLIHDSELGACGCVWVCVGCSCILVWILSSSGCFNQRDLEYPSINTFLSPEKLMAAERSGVVERVESTAITVSFCGWLNYNLWLINSSWCCQRRRGKEVSLWQHWNLEERFVSTNLSLPSKQLRFLKSQIKWRA